jgi:hypothetical protein
MAVPVSPIQRIYQAGRLGFFQQIKAKRLFTENQYTPEG